MMQSSREIKSEKQARAIRAECMKLEQILDSAVEKTIRRQAIEKLEKLLSELLKYESMTKPLLQVKLEHPAVSQVGVMDAAKLSQLARKKETAFIYEDYMPVMALISYQEFRELQYLKSLQDR